MAARPVSQEGPRQMFPWSQTLLPVAVLQLPWACEQMENSQLVLGAREKEGAKGRWALEPQPLADARGMSSFVPVTGWKAKGNEPPALLSTRF